jgi:hypothetical protein
LNEENGKLQKLSTEQRLALDRIEEEKQSLAAETQRIRYELDES